MEYTQVITTGGTIASLPNENGDVSAVLSGKELVTRLGISGNIKIKSTVTVGSYGFDYSTLYKIATDVMESLKKPHVKGVIITHGTDTIEETSFYLSLFVKTFNKPVILTGAQLDASYSFSDGAMNLKDAITAMESGQLNNLGVLVVFSGFIYSARDVRKVDTSALEGFGSPSKGPLGRVNDFEIILNQYTPTLLDLKPAVPLPVALIRLGIGMTGKEVARMAQGYSGVVIEAFGRGNSHPTIPEVVENLIKSGIPVIITTRCTKGSVYPIYGNGGGRDLERTGAWFAGDLTGVKARILLGVLLAQGLEWDDMEKIVNKVGQPWIKHENNVKI